MLGEQNSTISEFIFAKRERQVKFLKDLVHMPSDNPPGDYCAPHGAHAASLLEDRGFEVERRSSTR